MADRLMSQTFINDLQNVSDTKYHTFKVNATQQSNDNSLFYEAPAGSNYRYIIDYAKYAQASGGLAPTNPYDVSNEKNNIKPLSLNPKKATNPFNTGNNRIDVDELVKWSEKLTNGKLRYQDFAFCKHLGYYPNNRTIILRRFPTPIKDNLFDGRYEMKPVSTMINWLPPEKMNELLKFKFHENWTTSNKDFMDMLKDIFSKTGNSIIGKLSDQYVGDDFKNLGDKGLGVLEDLVSYAFLDKLAETATGKPPSSSLLQRFPEGNPNLLKEASMRLISGKSSSSNLSGLFSFNLEFEFECNRYLADIDPSIAFLDLLANAMRMSTSDSEFKMPQEIGDSFTQALIQGNISSVVKSVLGGFQSVLGNGSAADQSKPSVLSNFYDSLKVENIGKTAQATGNTVFKALVSKYIEEIKAAYAVMTGAPSGLWHLTVGNPKSPIISIGDLIVESSTVTFGTELGFNDLPTSFKYEIRVRSARNRGRQEIEQIFNSGMGRIYKRASYDVNGNFSVDSVDDSYSIRNIVNSVVPDKSPSNTTQSNKNKAIDAAGKTSSLQ
jgi:hypothetical protein